MKNWVPTGFCKKAGLRRPPRKQECALEDCPTWRYFRFICSYLHLNLEVSPVYLFVYTLWGLPKLGSISSLFVCMFTLRIAQHGGISSLFVHIYNLRISWTWYFLHFWLNPCPKTTITTTFAVITVIMSLFRRSPWNPCPRADCMSRDTGIGLILIIETGDNDTSYDGYHDTSYWL